MGATPRSSVLDPESPPPSLFAGASAAPSAISPPHAGFGVWGEGLPGRACVLPLGPGKCACPGALSDAIVRASAQRGRGLRVDVAGAEPARGRCRVRPPLSPLQRIRKRSMTRCSSRRLLSGLPRIAVGPRKCFVFLLGVIKNLIPLLLCGGFHPTNNLLSTCVLDAIRNAWDTAVNKTDQKIIPALRGEGVRSA